MITHCRHSDHRMGDHGSTTALLCKISPHITHPPTLHSSPTVMPHPTHMPMNQYASKDSFKREGTEFRFPIRVRGQYSCMLALLMTVVCVYMCAWVCVCVCTCVCGFVCVCVFPHPVLITSCCLSKGIVPRSNSLTLLPWCQGNTF